MQKFRIAMLEDTKQAWLTLTLNKSSCLEKNLSLKHKFNFNQSSDSNRLGEKSW